MTDNESEYPDDAPMWACEACDAIVPLASMRDFSTHSGEVSVCSDCREGDQ